MPKNKYNNTIISGLANDSYDEIRAIYPDSNVLDNPKLKSEKTLKSLYESDTQLTTEKEKPVNIFVKMLTG